MAPEKTFPFNITFALFLQTVTSAPASVLGAGVIVMSIVSLIIAQDIVEDRTNLTEPETVSAALKIYDADNDVSDGEKEPDPSVVH